MKWLKKESDFYASILIEIFWRLRKAMVERLADKMTSLYATSKTLRFRLEPIGKTPEFIQKNALLDKDKRKADDYIKIKMTIDEYHKAFIKDALSSVVREYEENQKILRDGGKVDRKKFSPEDFKELFNLYSLFKKDRADEKNRTAFAFACKSLRQKIVRIAFPSNVVQELTSAKLFNKLPAWVEQENKTRSQENKLFWTDTFKRFSSYFLGFHENRANMYSDDEKATAIAYRLVNENLPRFFDNIIIFSKINTIFDDIKDYLTENEKKFFSSYDFKTVFTPEYYIHCLSQDDILKYNTLIGGYSTSDKEKIRGMNEFINQHNQKVKDKNNKIQPLKIMYKQILSDRGTVSFLPQNFSTINEVYTGIVDFYSSCILYSDTNDGCSGNVFHILANQFSKIRDSIFDSSHIYIAHKALYSISKKIFGNPYFIYEALDDYYRTQYDRKLLLIKTKSEKEKLKKDFDVFMNKQFIPINLIDKACDIYANKLDGKQDCVIPSISEYCAHILEKVVNNKKFDAGKYEEAVYCSIKGELNCQHDDSYRPSQEILNNIKKFLDTLLESIRSIQHFVIPRDRENLVEKDESFYKVIDGIWENLSSFSKLYDKARNFFTGKAYSTGKIRLTFGIPALADGWDENKESDCRALLFMKDEQYYLGITSKAGLKFDKFDKIPDGVPCYQKMVYKYFPGPTKMIPKCTVTTKNVKKHFENESSDYILYDEKKYNSQLVVSKFIYDLYSNSGSKPAFTDTYLKETNDTVGYKKALVEWINFCKCFLKSYKSTADYNYDNLKDSNDYVKINEFYNDVARMTYRIKFSPIPCDIIDNLVESGKLYLFRIATKDFGCTHGHPNLHTLYWRALFSLANLNHTVIKLNGEASLFYRVSSIKDPTIHKKGSILVGRMTKDGKNIPEQIYLKVCQFANGKLDQKDADEEVLKYFERSVRREAPYDIIKDRRYTKNVFLFHVPLTFNFGVEPTKNINDRINNFLKGHDDVNIIGIDRGERNLLYISVVNTKGQILEQKSLNILDGIDYHDKLDLREKERAKARESWGSIGRIADLKEGYLSFVIHYLTDLIIRYNAIVVMEDLNVGFKRGRFKVEKQVYQKFEKALITKLNYLCFKDFPAEEEGGVLHGWQLTKPFESFRSMGHQNGIIFYIPAWNTSKIDPVTGFVDKIKPRYTNREAAHSLFSKFIKIAYCSEEDAFEFLWKDESSNRIWTITTRGKERYYWSKDSSQYGSVQKANVTEILKETFKNAEINWENSEDLIPILTTSDNTSLLKTVTWCLRLVLSMRYSSEADKRDFILSPVKMPNGRTFCSEMAPDSLPKDADANGAYNIARKGILVLERIKESAKNPTIIKNEDWLKYAQRDDVVELQESKYAGN